MQRHPIIGIILLSLAGWFLIGVSVYAGIWAYGRITGAL